MAKVKNRRDNHSIKRPKSSAGYKAFENKDEKPKKSTRPYTKQKKTEKDFDFEKENKNILIGRNPVSEALKSGREIDKIYVSNREGSIIKILGKAKDLGIPVMHVEKSALDRMANGKTHQGIIAYVSEYKYSDLEDIFNLAEKRGEDPFIIVLDGIEDPHNLGAIIRSAECSGAHGVIIPKRNAVGLTDTVAKTSAGAIEYMPIVKVTNIPTLIDELKERNVWTVCLDMDGEKYTKEDLRGSVAIVIGSEGFGVSRLVKEKCDLICSLPIKGSINSLNASNAAAVMMYEILRQRES